MDDDFQARLIEQQDRFQTGDWRSIEAGTAGRRLTWLREHTSLWEGKPVSPRRAFELLFFEKMGLNPIDLPVVSESDNEITWRSQNPCATLAACQALGLDTRLVCRASYEKSTQVFFSQVDPQLRFYRSYTEIRPYAPYCLEHIERVDFPPMMALAVEEARQSRREGNKGYGAVLWHSGRVVARAHDTAATAGDPSLHAELTAIRAAAQMLGDPNLSGGVLFATCEPCPMCSSLAVWANLTTIVYGVSIEETVQMGKARIRVGAAEIAVRSPVMLEVIGGVLAEECARLYAPDLARPAQSVR
ncbi:MAG TPA: nucleoside deaminase [Anaerolineaceae bacterium]